MNQIFVGDSRPIKLARVHNDLSMDDPQGVTDEDDSGRMKCRIYDGIH